MKRETWKLEHLTPIITFLCAAVVYTLTTPTDLTWAYHGADGGELITAAVTGGIPHPPGYPTYMLLGRLLTFIPLGSVAYRFNLFSGFCTAAAAAFLTAIGHARHPNRPWYFPVALALTFTFMPLVWSQAIITEVYALNLLLLSAALWALFTHTPPFITGLLCGLSLTTHLTSALMLPLAALHTPPRHWLKFGAGFFSGLTPYLLLFVWAYGDSPVIWGDARTLSGWWWLVSAQLYRPNLFAAPNQLLWQRLGRGSLALAAQLGFIGWGLVAYLWLEKRPSLRPLFPLAATAALYTLYALTYNTADAAVFTLPALLLLNIGLMHLLKSAPRLALFLPLLLLALNFYQFSPPLNDREASIQTVSALQQVPQQALVLTSGGGLSTFTLWYYHHVEQLRPDIVIVDSDLLAFEWYRTHIQVQYPSLYHVKSDDLSGFQEGNLAQRPVCPLRLQPLEVTCIEKSR